MFTVIALICAVVFLRNYPQIVVILLIGFLIYRWIGHNTNAEVKQADIMRKMYDLEREKMKRFDVIVQSLAAIAKSMEQKMQPNMNKSNEFMGGEFLRLAENDESV